MQCVKKNVGQLNSITDAALRPDKDTTLLAKAEILDHVTTHEKGFCPVGLSRSEKRSRAVGIGVHRAVVVGNVVTLLDGLAQGKGYGRREDWSIVTKGVVLAVSPLGSVPAGREATKPASTVRPTAAAPRPSRIVVTTTHRRPVARKRSITTGEGGPQSGSTTSMPWGTSCSSR